jgi:hypothetical protein
MSVEGPVRKRTAAFTDSKYELAETRCVLPFRAEPTMLAALFGVGKLLNCYRSLS